VRFYPRLDRDMLRFVIVEAAGSILRDLGESFARRVQRRLAGKGIEIRTETTLREVRRDAVVLSSGETIPAETVVWTAGVFAHPLVAQLPGEKDERGRVVTSPEMQVPGLSGVWALGDSAAVPDAKAGGETAPATAQHALRQARQLARNIAASVTGGRLECFSHGNLGMLATLGKHDGAGRLLGFPVSGVLAWWLVRTYHLLQLPTVARKARVVLDWTVGVLFARDIAQLGSLGTVRMGAGTNSVAAGAEAAAAAAVAETSARAPTSAEASGSQAR
jgi:NADH dehydrogenase